MFAASANADSDCTYTAATRTVTLTIGSGETAALAVQGDGADLFPEVLDGRIVLRQGDLGYEVCDTASNDNTDVIDVRGQETTSERFILDEPTGGTFNPSIAWSVEL